MPFEITHMKMVSSISCALCGTTLHVCTDDQRTIDRSIDTFQKDHRCKKAEDKGKDELLS